MESNKKTRRVSLSKFENLDKLLKCQTKRRSFSCSRILSVEKEHHIRIKDYKDLKEIDHPQSIKTIYESLSPIETEVINKQFMEWCEETLVEYRKLFGKKININCHTEDMYACDVKQFMINGIRFWESKIPDVYSSKKLNIVEMARQYKNRPDIKKSKKDVTAIDLMKAFPNNFKLITITLLDLLKLKTCYANIRKIKTQMSVINDDVFVDEDI